MRLGKLEQVKYISIKPPHAWSGTPAETDFDLPSIKEPTVIFQRHAGRCRPALPEERQPRGHRGAVRRGPRRAPTSSWSPIPPCRPAPTPAASRSSSDSGELKLERLGRSMPDNPKTGVLTALTMADDLMKMVRASDW